MGVHGVLQCHISCACISVSSSSLCQNAAFRCRSENGYRLEQIHVLLAKPISMHVEEISAVAQIKFLAAEALHRVSGLVFIAHGNCSANGLRKRDYVTGEMWKNKPSFRVVLNKAVSDDIARQCKHYTRHGVINFVSPVLKSVWVLYGLDSLCQPCFRVSLVSQHLCLSRQHQQQCPWRQRPWWSTAVVEYITPELWR